MYKKYLLILIMMVIVATVLSYIKFSVLYHPMIATQEKYDKFYQKLMMLTGSKDLIKNSIVNTSDGVQLDALFVRNLNSDKCVIFFHGNAGNMSIRYDMIKFLYNFCSVIIFDYRSYGKSGGDKISICCRTLQKDTLAIWNYATEEIGYHPNKLILFGESLGCSLAIWLASYLSQTLDSNKYPNSLILNSPFYSLSSMIDIIFSRMNLGIIGQIITMILGNEYQSNEWIKYINYEIQIIIAHSPTDEVIPFREGVKLFEIIKKTHQSIKFITISGTHNNLGLTDEYIYAIADLIDDGNDNNKYTNQD